MNQSNLLFCVKQGLNDFCRSISIYSPLDHSLFQLDAKRVIYSSGMNYAPCNGIVEKNESAKLTKEEIKEILQVFKKTKLPFIWWTQSPILEEFGFSFGGILKGIACDISKETPHVTLPKEITIRIAKSAEEIAEFSKIGADAFGMQGNVAEQFNKINLILSEKEEEIHLLGFYEGKPVGTLSLSTHQDSSGLWNGATMPQYRGKGICTALNCFALNLAKQKGYKEVMAILMPKGLAWGLTKKLGFKEICNYPFFVHGANPSDLEK